MMQTIPFTLKHVASEQSINLPLVEASTSRRSSVNGPSLSL